MLRTDKIGNWFQGRLSHAPSSADEAEASEDEVEATQE